MLAMWVFALAPGCSLDKCKNPKRGLDTEGIQGVLYQCNAEVTCGGHAGQPDTVVRLEGLNDPIVADKGYDSWNRGRCKFLAGTKNICADVVKIDASPELICLDAAGGPGPGVSDATGGTIVTVGAGSGDYHFNDEALEDGSGGAGGISRGPGEEGQGGI
jgi:hypothetical protein